MSGGKDKSEGRLSRWSRRKLAPIDNDGGKTDGTAAPVAIAEAEPYSIADTGGLTAKGFVKPMPPLAEPEEGEPAYAAAPADALALLDPENAPENIDAAALQAFPIRPEDEGEADSKDVPLTPEQEEAVKDLPPIDSLEKDSDFTPFFGPNIPDFLKRQAFKALWMSSPFFGFRDGLDDYDENFRIIEKIITAADSDYKPGKGYGFDDDEEGDDVGDGDDDGEQVSDSEEEVAAAEETDDETPKEPRKSDVRPPPDAAKT
jgi:hypothetical protein